jgi:hypothetical protein
MTAPDRPGGLAEVLDDHLAAEFAVRDVDATMATMTGDPYLNHVPVITGGSAGTRYAGLARAPGRRGPLPASARFRELCGRPARTRATVRSIAQPAMDRTGLPGT